MIYSGNVPHGHDITNLYKTYRDHLNESVSYEHESRLSGLPLPRLLSLSRIQETALLSVYGWRRGGGEGEEKRRRGGEEEEREKEKEEEGGKGA